eukprot:CAMPEP_0194108212 /NCGR_PEP_ID=MMETSP0150-20130528/7953_1 /TAXON_ID=122233 /ORGANISM="Chaetoceros debilis, Strain MM31A-1" /LENGTH=295 /DNA_ID=CAMNT_0038796855 /DNA_START=1 /DNA_END=888 /DNA_ORIENTATION=+
MKLYLYRGLEDEEVPRDVTHVIVDNSVTIIKARVFHNSVTVNQLSAFYYCRSLVSVIMGDNVKRIEKKAFCDCQALRCVRLSKTLEHIGIYAFCKCLSMEALVLPSTLKSIGNMAFMFCESLRLLNLSNFILDISNIGDEIIHFTAIHQIANTVGVEYEEDYEELGGGSFTYRGSTDESNRQVNEWLIHHMDEAPFHTLCYKSSVTTKQINDYLDEHGNDTAAAIDPHHGMNPLHMLSMNPHAPSDAIAALLDVKADNAFGLDNQGKMPLDYARDYNVNGLIAMIKGLCNHRHGT